MERPPFHLEEEDFDCCYFAREFISRAGYQASEANNLVNNFKKPVKYKGERAWHYRNQAVAQFAQELDEWLTDPEIAVSFVPSSRLPSDQDYDRRFEDLLDKWAKKRSSRGMKLWVESPLKRRVRTESLSRGNSNRNVQQTYESLEWTGFSRDCPHLVLLDDVITCGTHFKACQRLIRKHSPDTVVYGVFWARTTWPDAPS